ncbi:MAG: aromatic amino acid lyase [Taibaiella sp.]|nr:aromatic amino acid lyase [Taibaiella sp.]
MYNFDIKAFERVVIYGEPVTLDTHTIERVTKSFHFLVNYLPGRVIYGVNTGFGPMAQYRIERADAIQLQYNLISSHSSGMGQLIAPVQVRALMLARLSTLSLGFSGIHVQTVQLLADLINNGAYPCVYAHGGVGASGDLVQLAHLALGLIGKGKFMFRGAIVPAVSVYGALNLKPLTIHIREGLALLNGTSAMTGIGALNIIASKRLLYFTVLLSTVINELMEAYDDPFSEPLNAAKLHKGQNYVAMLMRRYAAGGSLLRKRVDFPFRENDDAPVFEDHVQESYSLRCVPQVAGPVWDTIINAQSVIENELNSVNDNPVIDASGCAIYHGGNFHGDYVALEMDKLKLVITKLSMLTERQLNFLLNPAINKRLPPFLNAGRLGLNFGMQGMQYPATSTVAENQALSTSLYIHSLPSNNDNQDIVSMGCNAALSCSVVIENAYEVLAINAAAVCQAIDILKVNDRLSVAGKWLHQNVRKHFPFFIADIEGSEPLIAVKEWLKSTDIENDFQQTGNE